MKVHLKALHDTSMSIKCKIITNNYSDCQGPIKLSVGPGSNLNSGPYSKSFKKFNYLS